MQYLGGVSVTRKETGDSPQRMARLVEFGPVFGERLTSDRMLQGWRQFRERPQYEGVLQNIRARQYQVRPVDYPVVVEQQVYVELPWGELFALPVSSGNVVNLLELPGNLLRLASGFRTNHQVEKIIARETHGAILINVG